ncbi:MAG: AEC family transporter [Candidatus Competibacteraceae bacterium]
MNGSFVAIVNSLAPVFLVMALGWMLRSRQFLSTTALQEMARLTYWVALPCLLFVEIAAANPLFGEAGRVFFVMATATGLGMALGYGLARWLAVPRAAIGTFLQAAFRGNLAFVGLPVIIYAFSTAGQNAAVAKATAVVVMGPMVALYNVAAVLALLLSRSRLSRQALNQAFKELKLNPLLLACLAGVVYAALNWQLPALVARTLTAIGQMSLPLALLCIGGSLVSMRVRGKLSWSLAAVVSKLFLLPLLGYAVAYLFGLSVQGTRIALILLACPTASVSYILVSQLGGDKPLASGAILISTLLAVLPLAVILALV